MNKILYRFKKVMLLTLPCILVYSCCKRQEQEIIRRPKYIGPTEEEYCQKLKSNTYGKLRDGTVELVTNDFPREGDIDQQILFEEILKEKFGLKLLPVFDSVYYPSCVMPVMDSVIAARYGPNGKDSIIKVVNHIVDSTFTVNAD